ncbi:MAG: hypothetical protein EA378_08660 [Phycisphaerales bacterium]|nr:MAG: hypothetical protein EA378_08660 [Phycisphaerales bacterium]
MRLCTTKLIHAFPELDALPEPEGERLLRRVRRFRQTRPALCVAAGLLAAGVWIAGAYTLGPAIWLAAEHAFGPMHSAVSRLLSLLLGPYLGCFLGGGVGLWLRDRLIASALRRGPEALRCPRCRYEIRGLHTDTDTLTCPECAHAMPMHAYGLCLGDLHN